MPVSCRRFEFCYDSAVGDTLVETSLMMSCEKCGRYFIRCCDYDSDQLDYPAEPLRPDFCRHRWPLTIVDGACGNNGQYYASGGLGIARGSSAQWQYSRQPPGQLVTLLDHGRFTNQAVELMAVIVALEMLLSIAGSNRDLLSEHTYEHVMGTDSAYVVEGIVYWYYKWQNHGWVNAKGQTPANLRLWHRLMQHVESLYSRGLQVGFIHIRRENTGVADTLAKRAANVYR